MSYVISLWLTFILSRFKSVKKFVELVTMKELFSVMCSMSILIRCFASLYVGAFIFLMTVRIGMLSLCNIN